MIMRKSTHQQLLAEQVKADDAARTALVEKQEADMIAFKSQIVEQAAFENAYLKREAVELRNQIAALNGKLVHHIDNPEEPRLADSGLAGQ